MSFRLNERGHIDILNEDGTIKRTIDIKDLKEVKEAEGEDNDK